MGKKDSNTSVRFQPELWANFRKRSIDEGRSAKAILEELMAAYLSPAAPISENSDNNSLTTPDKSTILSVRPEEQEPIEKLVGILRGGDLSAAKEIRRELDFLFGKIEADVHAGKAGTGGKEVFGELGGDTGERGVVEPVVRSGGRQTGKNKP